MNATPSLRKMWTLYKHLLVEDGFGRRDQVVAQAAFYSGARCVLKVMDHLVEGGDVDELHRLIRRHGRTIRRLQGYPLRKRRH